MYQRTDSPLQSWSPKGEIKGYALLVHGLNTRPSAMQPWVAALLTAGIHVTLVILTGHEEPRPNETNEKKHARRQAFRAATRESWHTDIVHGYHALEQVAPKGTPRFFVGYSLGGVLGGELIQQGKLHFDSMLLLAPALAMHRRNGILRWLPLPRRSLLPSVMPRRFRVHRWTPLSAYRELFRSVDALHGLLSTSTSSPSSTTALNIPTRVWIDPRDELVSLTGIQHWISQAQLDNWQVSRLSIAHANILQGCFHHLLIEPSCTGEVVWQQMLASIGTDLLAQTVVTQH